MSSRSDAATLRQLKSLPGILNSTQALDLDPSLLLRFSRLPIAAQKGALWEISGPLGSGKTEAALELLKENPEERVAWIEGRLSIHPPVLERFGVELSRVLFIELPLSHSRPWSLVLQTVQSQAFGIVVLSEWPGLETVSELDLRKLQLSAQKSGALVLLLASTPRKTQHWPISTQLACSREPGRDTLRIDLLKSKGGLR